MSPIEFYLNLREELLLIVTDVVNSGSWGTYYKPSISNSINKNRLERLLIKYKDLAEPLGIIKVTRHISCSNDNHVEYIVSNEYGLDIESVDNRFEWGFFQEMNKRMCKCPCSDKNISTHHEVLDELIYHKDQNIPCGPILSILEDVERAVLNSKNNKARSGVREHILMALININNQLMPGGMEAYVKHLKTISQNSASTPPVFTAWN